MPITFQDVSHIYSEGTPYRCAALTDVNIQIEDNRFTAIIGKTGSGKSTLIQHLNALLLPTEGTVQVAGRTITAGEDPKHLKSLRGMVGLVFQFPEYQLFEETILKDVAFGPKNFGCEVEEATQKAKDALSLVGIDASYFERSPLELSGGQKRRVAIAGILAMNPQVLVLDEPTAGLDPKGTREMMQLFSDIHTKQGKSILIVTHDMEQVYRYCEDVLVMENGKQRCHTSVQQFFKDGKLCRSMGILPPAVIQMKDALEKKGFVFSESITTLEQMSKAIADQVKHHG